MPGGSRRLDIIYHIDTQQAEAAADGFVQRQSAREKSTLTEAERLEQARERLIERSVQKRITELAKGQEAEEKASARILGKEEVTQKARENLLNRLNAKRIEVATAELAESNKMHRIHMAALDERMGKLGGQNKMLSEGVAAIGKFGAAILGLSGAQQIIAVLGQTFAQIRQDALKATEDVMRMRGQVRELQALRGEIGQTGSGVAHVFGIAKETLQSTEDVQAMESEGLGTGELAIKDDADKAEFSKAMVAAGRMQTVFGGSAGAYGKLMGQLALQSRSKGPLDAAELEARADRLFKIQQPGGFKNMDAALSQFSGLNALIMNDVYKPEEAMGLVSAFSVSSPNEAGTKAEQFTRAVMAGRIKSRGMKVADDVDMERTDAYFKGLGIGEQDSAIPRGKKIADDLAKQKGLAGDKGEKFNATEYLMLHGFANQQDALAIMDFAGLRNTGNLEKIEAAQNAPLEFGAISRRFGDRLAKDPFLKNRQLELGEQAATINEGLIEEPLVQAQHAAFNRLKSDRKITGSFADWQRVERGGISGSTEAGIKDAFMSNYHSQVTREMMHGLESERRRVGMPRMLPGLTESAHDYELRFARGIQDRGGDVTRGAANALDKAAENIRKATEKLDEVMTQQGPPPALIGGGFAAYAARAR